MGSSAGETLAIEQPGDGWQWNYTHRTAESIAMRLGAHRQSNGTKAPGNPKASASLPRRGVNAMSAARCGR